MADAQAAVHLALARDLEERDLDVASRLDVVNAVLAEVDQLRASAVRVRGRLTALPAEIVQAERDERDARVREADARASVEEAERALAEADRSRRMSADSKEQLARATRTAVNAAADAAAYVHHTRERLEARVREEGALQVARERFTDEAQELARRVGEIPRISDSGRSAPGASLDEIEEWAARAHAALFVVRGSLVSERDRLVTEANGLAAVALGDHGGGSSVSNVRKRIESAAQDG
jgi:chromosome segregation ATPase